MIFWQKHQFFYCHSISALAFMNFFFFYMSSTIVSDSFKLLDISESDWNNEKSEFMSLFGSNNCPKTLEKFSIFSKRPKSHKKYVLAISTCGHMNILPSKFPVIESFQKEIECYQFNKRLILRSTFHLSHSPNFDHLIFRFTKTFG